MIAKALKRITKDWFLAGMILAVVLATLFPEVGSTGGLIHADKLSDWGIFAIFFLHGLGLSTERMWTGMSRWKLHVVVQLMTFVVFPLFWVVLNLIFGNMLPKPLMLGFFYLCAVPSTISSSVALTGVAKGNVPGAIFNATLSSLIGVFATPFLASLVVQGGQGSIPLGHAIVEIAELLLLPFVIGQALRPILGRWFEKHRKTINPFDKCVILLLVFSSFCDSVKSGLWTNYGAETLVVALIGAAVILTLALLTTTNTTKWLGFDRGDHIAAVMCGSKKSLAGGVPMAKLLFVGNPAIGLIVLPLMFYHQLQLFVCSILAERYAKSAPQEASPQEENRRLPEANGVAAN